MPNFGAGKFIGNLETRRHQRKRIALARITGAAARTTVTVLPGDQRMVFTDPAFAVADFAFFHGVYIINAK